jgi:hypothetical protein
MWSTVYTHTHTESNGIPSVLSEHEGELRTDGLRGCSDHGGLL